MSKNYGILFPNGATSTLFGSWALSQGHHLSLYCPGGPDYQMTRYMVTDLEIIAVERARLRGEESPAFRVIDDINFTGVHTFVVPNIDMLPQNPDKYYVDLCMNSFRQVFFKDLVTSYLWTFRPLKTATMDDGLKVVFGHNNR